ncbi:hypothetical protein DFJ73DRAFT_758931 [Zopfochytrium polystomum]|nr:hypothetical protein DFJ73DRAFT_758931 [Zopfochytrium polystomum]
MYPHSKSWLFQHRYQLCGTFQQSLPCVFFSHGPSLPEQLYPYLWPLHRPSTILERGLYSFYLLPTLLGGFPLITARLLEASLLVSSQQSPSNVPSRPAPPPTLPAAVALPSLPPNQAASLDLAQFMKEMGSLSVQQAAQQTHMQKAHQEHTVALESVRQNVANHSDSIGPRCFEVQQADSRLAAWRQHQWPLADCARAYHPLRPKEISLFPASSRVRRPESLKPKGRRPYCPANIPTCDGFLAEARHRVPNWKGWSVESTVKLSTERSIAVEETRPEIGSTIKSEMSNGIGVAIEGNEAAQGLEAHHYAPGRKRRPQAGQGRQHMGKMGLLRRVAFAAKDVSSRLPRELGSSAATPGEPSSGSYATAVDSVIACSQLGEGVASRGELHDIGVREMRVNDGVDENGGGKPKKR